MKTFKLKALEIIENKGDGIIQNVIPLIDGLIINREDDQGWLVEAYVDHSYLDYFKALKEEKDETMIQVKITKESNEPAFFITSIIGINKIGENQMNVLFQGKVVDHRKGKIEEMLQTLLEEGYQGVSLLKKFKELI